MLKEILMQHFFYGLKPESAHFMNEASEGSVMYRTVAEVRTLLEKVLNSTEYTGIYDDPPEPLEQPSETQQLRILSAISSPPPPYIEEITEPPKSPDHEPFIEDICSYPISSQRKSTWNSAMLQACQRNISVFAQDLMHSFPKFHCR